MRANRILKLAVAYSLAAASSVALAQTPPPPASNVTELETVIVTGSYIKGAAEDAALPVDVISSEDLAKQGSPNMTDMVKSIPAVQSVIGESNQFGVSQAAGTANVNLRGLGAARTLVLLNGKRLATAPSVGVTTDINLLPTAAIGRVEVLKDGAAATYGSDAIGGVVNFITKEQQGFAIDGAYSHIDGSDGEYNANASWGWQGDIGTALVAAGYRHRSELPTLERDWALRPRAESAEGGWTGFSNPGTFTALTAGSLPIAATVGNPLGGAVLDPACAALGGTPVPTCTFQYTAFDNLVEDEDHFNVYGEFNLELSDAFKLHTEALWAMHEVDGEHGSPSYGPNQGPNGGAPTYYIPFVNGNAAVSNPGLTALYPFLPADRQALINTSNYFSPASTGSAGLAPGIVVSGLQWRPFAQGGNPLTGGPQLNSRKFDGFRLAADASGDVSDLFSWKVGGAYAENGSEISTPDFLVSRLQLALRGLGGPNCSGSVAGAGGCLWLNPFSTAIPVNAATGAVNTVTAGTIVPNDPELVRWITAPNSYETTSTLKVVDVVFNGELGFLSLPGGNVGWAAGAQYRENTYELVVTDPFANPFLNPCPATPVNPAATCTIPDPSIGSPPGALSFYGPTTPRDVSQDVIAGFAEFNLPILDSLSAQLAVRHEDYGDPVGSTTNPKIALRYQPLDMLTFRGSYGSTFRAPPQTTLTGQTTFLFFTPQAGGYKPVDTVGNPNLKPEEADTFNVGIVVKAGGFAGSLDYWKFKFEKALTTEVGTQLVTAMYSSYTDTLGNPQFNHCNDPLYAGLLTRFTFTGAGCNNPGYNPALGQTTGANALAANLLRTRVNNINAQTEINISGLDVSLSYLFDGVLGGDLMLATDATYNLEYKLGANYVEGVLIDPETDAIGTRGGRGGSQPQWKGAAFVNYATGDHNVRVTARYVDKMEERYRPTTFATNTKGITVDSMLTFDLTYNVLLPGNVSLNTAVINVTDEDPSFARLDLNYDPSVHNPLGRYFKVGVGVKF